MNLSEQSQIVEAAKRVQGREITVPLKHLFRHALNVRRKAPARSVEELAALIYSQGLLQNVIVQAEVSGKKAPKPTGRYGVVAGGRRLEALNFLFTQGKVTADFPVRCLEVSQDDAVSVSLAENCGREPLHGADQLDAFAALLELGKTVGQIADAWGISPLTVERRLKLAKISPKLMALYRDDKIELEQLMALTLTDSHELQETLWENTPSWERSAYNLRRKLTECDVPSNNPLVQFVGFAAYEAAGGNVRRDLFSENENAPGFMTEPALLQKLALDRLERGAEAVRTEGGWQWVEVRTSLSYTDRQAFAHYRTLDVAPSDGQQERLDALESLLSELEAKIDNLNPEDDSATIDLLEGQQRQAEAEREAIEQTLQQIDPRDLPLAGAVVYVDQRGELAVLRGLVRAEDRKAQVAQGDTAAAPGSAGTAKAKAPKADYSEKLLRQLTAHRTAALRATLADSPAIALRVLAYQLAVQTGLSSRCGSGDRPVEIRADTADVRKEGADLAECKAQQEMEAHAERWGQLLPGDQRALLAWVLKADDSQVLDLLAVCTASTLNTVQGREAPQPIADAIAAAVGLDMSDFWQADAHYLGAVPKAKIIDAVREGAGAEAAAGLEGLKKGEAVALAQQRLQGTRWLPPVLQAKG
ncbi:ParB/RepB/Spo0J family partition protein [Azohydromonas aeria]|uniref:ParB/RepB/Spo0J family partition protein n=1 Tax=Azohydromonas aeria TaxID=2590212 RepID=UPI0018DF5765|nr:ParB/RepB/Spo0J family partition protein [Azohydromonas aeria]